jgi:hypothetical protein
MSHFTRIRTQIVEREYLLKALEEAGYSVETGDLTVKGLAGERARAEIKIKVRLGREIGFRKAGNAYEIITDPWGLGLNMKEFTQQITQRYAYHTAVGQLQAQGFDLVNQETAQDGQIRLTLRRMA